VECHSASQYRASPLGSTVTAADPYAGLPLSPALGMTETFGMYSWVTRTGEGHPTASPLDVFEPYYDVKAVGRDGKQVGDGEAGETIVRGPTVTRQLIKIDQADVFDPDGFLRTGDRGLREGARIHFLGRLRDTFKTSGANVAPPEVERELVQLPGVEAAFVTGLDHPTRGQEVVAAVIWSATDAFDAGELRRALLERLSPYKVPRRMVEVTWEQVPMTPSRKVNRREFAGRVQDLSTNHPPHSPNDGD
jgi:acyl-CoA synthetase (AMP-forming)/AMP-acid ligase II